MRIFPFSEAPTDAILSFARGNLNLVQFSFNVVFKQNKQIMPKKFSQHGTLYFEKIHLLSTD